MSVMYDRLAIKKYVDLIEDVQRKFTKFLTGMYDKSYRERLALVGMITLEERRIYSDLVLLYKIIHNLIDITFENFFNLAETRTRGHSYKLRVVFSRVNCHKYHFFNRIVNV